MIEEEKITVSLNQEEVQNILDAYGKDLKYIEQLEERINKSLEYIKENSFYLELPSIQEKLIEILKGVE
jgi:hypothetical protein